ncbi:hypothetical protein AKO1_013683 [Acrasis kona]|uniref:Oxysterol-binding protein n=1 Tax=Acrasis kona TaxID=1008807 RepID=A0AAW2YUC7_9EUKA
MELWRLSVPTFILQPVSMLEKLSHYSSPNEIIKNVHKNERPEGRFLQVLNWLLSNWRTIPRHGLEASKPYNPILGEIFKCEWEHQDGSKAKFIAEQISHHPPVSAFEMSDPSNGDFKYSAWVYPQTTISYYVASIMTGEFNVSFVPEGQTQREVYSLKQPPVSCTGILYGEKYIEIYDKMELTCANTNLHAEITFESGGTNALSGKVYRVMEDGEREDVYEVSGVINQKVEATNARTKSTQVLFDTKTLQRLKKNIRPVAEQDENESRRVWHHLTKALKEKNFDDAQLQKHIVEERERTRRKKITEEHLKKNPPQPKKEEKPAVVESSWTSSLWSIGSSVVTAMVGSEESSEQKEDSHHKFGHPGFEPVYFADPTGENHWTVKQ